MFYHNLGRRNHGFEISISEMTVLAQHVIKNGGTISINLNEINVKYGDDWEFALLYDNGDGLYHLCCPREQQNTSAEWLVDFFETRNMLNV